jgi:hypothetical protein
VLHSSPSWVGGSTFIVLGLDARRCRLKRHSSAIVGRRPAPAALSSGLMSAFQRNRALPRGDSATHRPHARLISSASNASSAVLPIPAPQMTQRRGQLSAWSPGFSLSRLRGLRHRVMAPASGSAGVVDRGQASLVLLFFRPATDGHCSSGVLLAGSHRAEASACSFSVTRARRRADLCRTRSRSHTVAAPRDPRRRSRRDRCGRSLQGRGRGIGCRTFRPSGCPGTPRSPRCASWSAVSDSAMRDPARSPTLRGGGCGRKTCRVGSCHRLAQIRSRIPLHPY